VSITAWRITKRKHARAAFAGNGARKYGGRWNSPGIPVVYTAESQALAVLEMLVHLDSAELLPAYVLIGVEIDQALVADIDHSRLPRYRRAVPAPPGLRAIGDEWVLAGRSPVLRVPSTLVPAENNLLLNPLHRDFSRLRIGDPIPFRFDPRLAR
jgi:RES domain-containing protein